MNNLLSKILTKIEQSEEQNDLLYKELINLVLPIEDINPTEFKKLSREISDKTQKKIILTSGKLALVAIKNKNQNFIRAALILQALENFQLDPRENILRLSLIWEVCKKLKLNFKEEINLVKQISSKRTITHLNEFYERPDYMKSLKTMGFCIMKENENYFLKEKIAPWMKN
ncbi:hypothetical protein [uncultured Aquimarina sp.]|uniref:hypothetical protein n=1 Tax=uncultured Aquimarina sp. TaxID=575652 RepID=UPI00261CAC09|nr:hypothetical protein [uncultured Aquimarina sp.]